MKKRILIVIESLAQGGAQRVSINMANGMLKHGQAVGFAAPEGGLRGYLNPEVKFFEIPSFSLLHILKVFAALSCAIKAYVPDVIHFHSATYCLVVRLLFLFRKHPLLVLSYHSKKPGRMPDFLSGVVFDFIADKIITGADYRRNSLLRSGVARDKLFLVPNFISMKEWGERQKQFNKQSFRTDAGLATFDAILLISARLTPLKRVDMFLQIVKEVAAAGRNVAGIILGDGPEMVKLKQLAKQLNITDRVSFAGFAGGDVIPYYLASDLFVFPTNHPEVLPMALIEACAVGLPMVCSAIPGNNEIVSDGVNGFLVSGQAREYAEKTLMLLNEPALYSKFSKNAREIAAKFDEETCINQTLQVYTSGQ